MREKLSINTSIIWCIYLLITIEITKNLKVVIWTPPTANHPIHINLIMILSNMNSILMSMLYLKIHITIILVIRKKIIKKKKEKNFLECSSNYYMKFWLLYQCRVLFCLLLVIIGIGTNTNKFFSFVN